MHHMSNSSSGAWAETQACSYLVSLGFRVVARNVRMPGGEIDIVAQDGPTLVFIEVKRRRRGRFGTALAAVDARKRARLRALAADFAQVVAPEARYRFDIVALDGNRLTLHRNAF